MADRATETEDGRLKFMQQMISLDYAIRVPVVSREFGRRLKDGEISGHECPQCGLVYVPPRGFCPICVVETTWEQDAVTVSDTGTLTSWTVLTPIQYHGQQERDDYALASILLDGADGTIGQQRLLDIPLDEIRMGVRVEAVWADPSERSGESGDPRGYGFGDAIRGFRPSGEPDADRETYEKHTL
ncbi:MAG: OB-fold domain-containing protein [Acidimicrobiales bacterium]|nr:OB-fold domain-containing protein [Acidimicrobiales bacterium]